MATLSQAELDAARNWINTQHSGGYGASGAFDSSLNPAFQNGVFDTSNNQRNTAIAGAGQAMGYDADVMSQILRISPEAYSQFTAANPGGIAAMSGVFNADRAAAASGNPSNIYATAGLPGPQDTAQPMNPTGAPSLNPFGMSSRVSGGIPFSGVGNSGGRGRVNPGRHEDRRMHGRNRNQPQLPPTATQPFAPIPPRMDVAGNFRPPAPVYQSNIGPGLLPNRTAYGPGNTAPVNRPLPMPNITPMPQNRAWNQTPMPSPYMQPNPNGMPFTQSQIAQQQGASPALSFAYNNTPGYGMGMKPKPLPSALPPVMAPAAQPGAQSWADSPYNPASPNYDVAVFGQG